LQQWGVIFSTIGSSKLPGPIDVAIEVVLKLTSWVDLPLVNDSPDSAIHGNVISNNFLLPNMSIVYTAGSANTKFTMPNPHEPIKDEMTLSPPIQKMVKE